MKLSASETTLAAPYAGVMQSPGALLLVTGTLIGLNFPLGKIAGDAGVSPLVWALLVSLGGASMLLPVLLARGRLVLPGRRVLRYVVISALVSFVGPNLLLFSVIPHAGAGYTGLMFALSPVFTLALATLFRLRTPGRIGLVGIAIGLIGAAIVSVTRGSAPEAPPVIWIIAALLIPVALACGNVYRTLAWPEDALPDGLAFWSHAFSATLFVALLLATRGSLPVAELAPVPLVALAQVLVAGMTYPVFFRLQKRGGPVLLSQIGYVAAAVGLIAATFVLGEHYSAMTWAGAAVIAVGIVITLVAQARER